MARIRITNTGKYASTESYAAEIRSIGVSGSIDKHYIRKEKQAEVEEHGFAYTNQPKERVV